MKVDIYISEKTGSREIHVPLLPEKIKIDSGGATMATYDIMNRGEVAVPMGSGLMQFSWESEFPGKLRKADAMLRGSWKEPKRYHDLLDEWRRNGTALNLLVTGYPINCDVYLEQYSAEASGAFGDIVYDVNFVEMREITIKTSTAPTPKRTETQSKTTSYTIKKGDTLWGISKRFLGSGAKWTTIYKANKDIIESTAKKCWKAAGINRDSQNGHWIFPGTVIKIPK